MLSLRLVACLPIVLAAPFPVAAQQNSYGGYDIVARPGEETYYSEARGWRVFTADADGRHAYCFAESIRSDGSAFRIGWDGQQWQLAVPVTANPDWQGTLQIDGSGSGQGYGRGGDDISGTAVRGWTIAWLGLAELDGLRKGNYALLGVGRADYDFSLAGATAATLKVEECVQRGGRTASAPAAPSDSQSDGPSEAELRPFASAGSWVVNQIAYNGAVLACETYDTVKPYLRFEIDRDNSYIDFKDGSAFPVGGVATVSVSFGPGSTGTWTDVMFIEGRDGDGWARITESRVAGPGFLDDAIPNAAQVSFIGPNILLETDLYGSNAALSEFFRCSGTIR